MSRIRDKMFSTKATKSKLVHLDEPLSIDVEVRSMTVGAKLALVAAHRTEGGGLDVQAALPKLLIASCFEPETGEAAFDAADTQPILDLDYEAVEPLLDAVLGLNGFTSVAATAKNSEPAPTSSSPTE